MSGLDKSRQHVLLQLSEALSVAGRRSDTCQLIAVSKTFPASDVRELYACGQRAFGENYVQELEQKHAELADLVELEWHFIGPLQSNKTRSVAQIAHWVHSVDRLKIAERLSVQRPVGLPPLNVLVQVNVSGESSKSGCLPDEAAALCRAVVALPGLALRGLMCIPEATTDELQLAQRFDVMQHLLTDLRAKGLSVDTLSMGMSADMALAVQHGATMVRVGTAIFGRRHYPDA
ncbi:YggS family pyridoxal phosphate-dependent enzyme [Burkholderiaceae bacterium DAT-1]|nr:YggS family pyridoxal phosphate-dependent enzyme [Burkholderiaceae bacterium DAT-1]